MRVFYFPALKVKIFLCLNFFMDYGFDKSLQANLALSFPWFVEGQFLAHCMHARFQMPIDHNA